MTPWLIWSLVIGLLVLLAVTKLGVHFLYDGESVRLRVLIGPLRLELMQKQKKRKNIASDKTTLTSTPKKSFSWKPWMKAILHRLDEVLALCSRILRTPTFDLLRIHVIIADGEPDEKAIKYGRICAAVGSLLEPVENVFTISKRSVVIYCSFEDEVTSYEAEAAITLRVYEVIALLFAGLKLIYSLYCEVKDSKKEVHNI